MADPHTSGPRRAEAPPAEDEGRIEHLLVTGLDHYFAGEFDAAINLWTRVLFLDRSHDRARAYIDRARSAQAEQQRISEALVHEGLEAFDRGEVVRARALLSDALDQGASHDVALGVIGRIDRLDLGQRNAAPVGAGQPRAGPRQAGGRRSADRRSATGQCREVVGHGRRHRHRRRDFVCPRDAERPGRLVPGASDHRRARDRHGHAGAAAGAAADRNLPDARARAVCQRQVARRVARARSRAARRFTPA